jgi:hypothetical protein
MDATTDSFFTGTIYLDGNYITAQAIKTRRRPSEEVSALFRRIFALLRLQQNDFLRTSSMKMVCTCSLQPGTYVMIF